MDGFKNADWMRFGLLGDHRSVIGSREFRDFSLVLLKLWCMDPKVREWDPSWRALKALVFLVEG